MDGHDKEGDVYPKVAMAYSMTLPFQGVKKNKAGGFEQ
jgi:hypothetical protein